MTNWETVILETTSIVGVSIVAHVSMSALKMTEWEVDTVVVCVFTTFMKTIGQQHWDNRLVA